MSFCKDTLRIFLDSFDTKPLDSIDDIVGLPFGIEAVHLITEPEVDLKTAIPKAAIVKLISLSYRS